MRQQIVVAEGKMSSVLVQKEGSRWLVKSHSTINFLSINLSETRIIDSKSSLIFVTDENKPKVTVPSESHRELRYIDGFPMTLTVGICFFFCCSDELGAHNWYKKSKLKQSIYGCFFTQLFSTLSMWN